MPSTTRSPLLFWATVILTALGSASIVHATLPALFDGAAAAVHADSNVHADLAAMPLMHRATTANLQAFTGALANIAAPAIAQSNDATRPYSVNGDTFADYQTAAGRACDNQHNECANAANSQKSASFSVGDCDTQNSQCKSAASSATKTAFTELTTSSPDFEIFCDL